MLENGKFITPNNVTGLAEMSFSGDDKFCWNTKYLDVSPICVLGSYFTFYRVKGVVLFNHYINDILERFVTIPN